MKLKKVIALACLGTIIASSLAGCGTKDSSGDSKKSETTTLKVAALESAYGADMWKEIATAFEKINPGVKVELQIDKKIEDIIDPAMKAGNYPDVVHLAIGRDKALTETLIKENQLSDLTSILDMTVPGEEKKVKDKIIPGFTDTLVTNPYSDGKTYLAPMFYGPCGLFYNEALFQEKGWELPKTWDEMWELGEKAKKEGISLFTYPTTGYFDTFFYALLSEVGGPEFYNKAMNYSEGIWDTPEAKQAFDIVGKLAKYTEPSTVGNANDSNYKKNQQLVLDNKALFMPNGNWVIDEMKEAPRADGFKWGFMALPAVKDGGDRYSFTFFEQIWSPKEAKNPEMANKFITFMYSDEAAVIFAKHGAIQPINTINSLKDAEGKEVLQGDNKIYYSIYDNGAKAALGGFAATEPVEGVSMADTLFGTVNSIVSGDKTVEQWRSDVIAASDKLRAALK